MLKVFNVFGSGEFYLAESAEEAERMYVSDADVDTASYGTPTVEYDFKALTGKLFVDDEGEMRLPGSHFNLAERLAWLYLNGQLEPGQFASNNA